MNNTRRSTQYLAWKTYYVAGASDTLDNNYSVGTSLVARWLRIRLPMQGTRVRALVQEDPT